MSNYCELIGHIDVPTYWNGAEELNRLAIAGLPEQDEHPWLIRSMFAMPSTQTYRDGMYHFGTVLAGHEIDREWEQWIAKFESLLRKMCWISAKVHFTPELFPQLRFTWLAHSPKPGRPVKKWERRGGPCTYTDLSIA